MTSLNPSSKAEQARNMESREGGWASRVLLPRVTDSLQGQGVTRGPTGQTQDSGLVQRTPATSISQQGRWARGHQARVSTYRRPSWTGGR